MTYEYIPGRTYGYESGYAVPLEMRVGRERYRRPQVHGVTPRGTVDYIYGPPDVSRWTDRGTVYINMPEIGYEPTSGFDGLGDWSRQDEMLAFENKILARPICNNPFTATLLTLIKAQLGLARWFVVSMFPKASREDAYKVLNALSIVTKSQTDYYCKTLPSILDLCATPESKQVIIKAGLTAVKTDKGFKEVQAKIAKLQFACQIKDAAPTSGAAAAAATYGGDAGGDAGGATGGGIGLLPILGIAGAAIAAYFVI